MQTRRVERVISSVPTSDGAGVKLRRSLGSSPGARLDPFLMLDEFATDEAADYAAGFPAHPHRGFETVTYMLAGHMRHEDHLGNQGDLKAGGVQWMTAGRGIVHSEMPQQSEGRMHGFQLWLNLPAATKMQPAAYRDIPADEIPEIHLAGGGRARLIAGRVKYDGRVHAGPAQAPTTEPVYLDVAAGSGENVEMALPATHSAFVYVYAGDLSIAGEIVNAQQAGILSDGEGLQVSAGNQGARFLLLAGRPLHEPVVQYGPFVMNSREEIEQALRDYRDGSLAEPA